LALQLGQRRADLGYVQVLLLLLSKTIAITAAIK